MCLKNSGDDVLVRVTILKCFTSWVMVKAIPLHAITTSDVVAYAFQVHTFFNIDKDPIIEQ